LFVRRIVLFIHDNETKILKRRKDTGAGTYNDVHVTPTNSMPLVVPLAIR
jgi:hypothetical protein